MGTEWSEDELDRWFEEDFLDGAPPSGATFNGRFGGDATDFAEHDEDLQAFMAAWDNMTDATVWAHLVKLVNREPEDAWAGLSLETKARLRRAHERYLQGQPPSEVEGALPSLEAPGESAVDDLAGTGVGGRRLVLPLVIGGMVVLVAVVVGSGALSGDDAPDPAGASAAPVAAPSSAAAPDGDQAAPVTALPAPRPEADEPATITLAGDDVCGNMASMQDTEVNLAAGPSGQGGRIRFLGRAGMTPEALTGVLTPGADGPVWEDVTGTEGGVEDAQALDDVVVGDGLITGSLTWTDHDACTAVFDVEYSVPAALTQWFLSLPAAAPADCEFDGAFTHGPEELVVNGTLTDLDGAPMAGGEIVVTVYGSDGVSQVIPAVTDADGTVRVEVATPPGEPDSISVEITKGAHGLATLFLE